LHYLKYVDLTNALLILRFQQTVRETPPVSNVVSMLEHSICCNGLIVLNE